MNKNYAFKYKHLFDNKGIAADVNRKSVKAGIYNLGSQGLSLFITLIRAAILARLLSPEDYGILAMVIVVASFVLIFKDLGLGTATIREVVIDHSQVSNLFWVNSLVGLGSMCLVVIFSPAIAWFYGDERLVPVAAVLSLGFFFGGMTVQHQALLKRQMRFDKIAKITVFSSLFSSVAGCVLAYYLRDYWALVLMQVLQSFLLMIGFWHETNWMPSLPKRDISIRKFLKVGFDVAGLNAFSTITSQIDKILIGKLVGATALGFYNKGRQVPGLISGQLRLSIFAIALPALSSLQEDKKKFADYYYRFLSVISWISIPLGCFCYIYSNELITIYFGKGWESSVPFMKIFSIYACIMPAMTSLDQIPLALGYTRRYLIAGILRSMALIVSVSVAAPLWGVTGVAYSLVISDLLIVFPFAILCLKGSQVTIIGILLSLSSPVICSISLVILFFIFKINFFSSVLIYFIILCGVFIINDVLNKKCSLGVVNKICKFKRK